MKKKSYKGIPYSLWNPFSDMDELTGFLGFGPIVIEKGEGAYVLDGKGRKYISGFSGLWNVAIGYGRQELIDAASKQMKELAFASCFRQTHPKAIELADKLVQISPKQYEYVYLGTNGSEAVETAIKIARQYAKQSKDPGNRTRYKIISLKNSYHGVSLAAMSTSGLESEKDKFGPLPDGFEQIAPPYCYRCPYGEASYPECGLKCAAALKNKIEDEGAETVAAFILEPIMGAYGLIVPPEEYYEEVGKICNTYGILFIADEVTTGFGRTGKLFMTQDWKYQPDILCLAKAISSGYLPLSATLVTAEIFECFLGKGKRFNHGSTASGHPVCAAVGMANIDIIINENIPENASRIGTYLLEKLNILQQENELIGDVRGQGLMIGIELVKDRATKEELPEDLVMELLMDASTRGLIFYFTRSVIGIMPPLIIDEKIADDIVSILSNTLHVSKMANIKRKAKLAKEFSLYKLGV